MKSVNKKKAAYFIYGRTIFVILAMLIQASVLMLCFTWLARYKTYINIGFTILSAILVIYIINSNKNPAYKLAWIIPMLIFPVFGGLIYLFFKLQPGQKKIAKRLKIIQEKTQYLLPENSKVAERLTLENKQQKNLSNYLYKIGGYPTYDNTEIEYFTSGKEKLIALIPELEKAEKFIFLEYFIIEESHMWDEVLDILKKKAAQGVEVRIMYDGMGCMTLLPYSYPKQMEQFGILCKIFQPLIPLLDSIQNNRDHRKILVIDGNAAFTGGINFADEYINEKERFGYWKDTAVMIKGEAVRSFTLMFLQMWNITEKNKEDYKKYITELPVYEKNEALGFVIPYGDSPLDDENVGEHLYMDILNTAERYVHIMTPYLVIDNEMITTLLYAAKRGVEVKLILPHRPDKKLVSILAHNYYPQLIKGGVQIYEYIPGFVHAKVFTSDDMKAVVGSVNLDYRSFYLHFECGAYMYGCEEIDDIEKDFQKTLLNCKFITMKDYKELGIIHRLIGHILKVFAPLM